MSFTVRVVWRSDGYSSVHMQLGNQILPHTVHWRMLNTNTKGRLFLVVNQFTYMTDTLSSRCVYRTQKACLKFTSFFNTHHVEVVKILRNVIQILIYFTQSVSWLIMSWWHREPGYRRQCDWPSYTGITRSQHDINLITRFMGQTWGPSGTDRPQVGPMLAPWPLLSG